MLSQSDGDTTRGKAERDGSQMPHVVKGTAKGKSDDLPDSDEFFCIVNAPRPEATDHPADIDIVQLGVPQSRFRSLGGEDLRTAVGQFWGMVQPGLVLAKHCFRGLKRGMYVNGNADAVVIYSWKSRYDYTWSRETDGGLIKRAARKERVFVVLARPIGDGRGDPCGKILRWNWVAESPELKCAPIDYEARYIEKLWSR